jgi:hypothetical protein
MQKDRKQSPVTSDGGTALHGNIIDLIPVAKAHSDRASGFALIDQAAEAMQASEQRASHAEEKAHKISSKAIDAVRAAQLRIEQVQAQARLIERHAAEQAKLAEERIAKTEALAQERIDQAQTCAHDAEERARAAESRLRVAEARADDAEERLAELHEALRRKLPSPQPSNSADRTYAGRCLQLKYAAG